MRLRNLFLSAILFLSFQQLCFAGDKSPFRGLGPAAGDTISDDRKVTKFTVLKIQGNFHVVLTPDADYSLKVNGNKATVATVQSKMVGTGLNINMPDGTKDSATLYISFKDINQISINGQCAVSATKQVKSDDLKLDLEGNTRGSIDMKVKMLTFVGNTDQPFTLTGKVETCAATVKGDGALDLSQLKADELRLDFGTDTDIKIFAKDLNLTMGGAGNVTCYGNPKKKVVNSHGTGEFKLGN